MDQQFPEPIEKHVRRDLSKKGCHLWYGPSFANGYPAVISGREKIGARRLIWEIDRGRKCRGSVQMTCGNVMCVNPEHMR